MAIDIVARALAVSGKQSLENYYTKTESDAKYSQATNLENGTGENSVRQKYIVDGVDYSANASGINSIALGGKRFDKLTDTTRTSTSAEGNQSFAAGGSVHAHGDFTIALGKDTDAYQRASLAAGGGTKAGFTESEFNAYYWDSVNNKALHNGQGKDENGNILDWDGKTYTESYSFAVALGEINYVYGRDSISSGFGNRVYGAYAGTFGKANRVNAGGGITGGYNNIVDSSSSIIVGGDNEVSGTCSNVSGLKNTVSKGTSVLVSGNRNNIYEGVQNSAAIGQLNEIKSNQSFAANYHNYIGTGCLDSAVFGTENTVQDGHANAFVAGKGNKTANYSQSIFGTYNNPNGSALFQIGNGDSDTNRKTAFEILYSGKVKAKNAPVDNDDVVRKLELVTSWNNFNLENGTGKGSLRNKGSGSIATGADSLAIGNTCKATNNGTSSFGQNSIASGINSHAEGYASTSAGADSHAEGNNTTSSGWGTHSEGIFTQAIGIASHAGGYYTIAQEDYQQVIGKYNANSSNALFIIGNGTSTNNRKNAFEVLKDGRAKVQSAPTEDDDVVRKLDLSDAISAIPLDSVITTEMVDVIF